MPSSRATVATARPVLITSFTASSLYSGVNSRRCLPMTDILTYEVSTVRGQGHIDCLTPHVVRSQSRPFHASGWVVETSERLRNGEAGDPERAALARMLRDG